MHRMDVWRSPLCCTAKWAAGETYKDEIWALVEEQCLPLKSFYDSAAEPIASQQEFVETTKSKFSKLLTQINQS